jgi:hypothetical protein
LQEQHGIPEGQNEDVLMGMMMMIIIIIIIIVFLTTAGGNFPAVCTNLSDLMQSFTPIFAAIF